MTATVKVRFGHLLYRTLRAAGWTLHKTFTDGECVLIYTAKGEG